MPTVKQLMLGLTRSAETRLMQVIRLWATISIAQTNNKIMHSPMCVCVCVCVCTILLIMQFLAACSLVLIPISGSPLF